MARNKAVWGTPGQAGVTNDGIPWYMPDEPPGFMERMLYKVFPGNGTSSFPAGARLVPARTAAEVRERSMRKYGGRFTGVLRQGERIEGFIGFALSGDHVPQPPRVGVEAKLGPNPLKDWWMGGGWDSAAGQLVIAGGSSRSHDAHMPSAYDRHFMLARTSHRFLILIGAMDGAGDVKRDNILAQYGLNQLGIRPDWQPQDHGNPERVDIAFIDGSWLGLLGYDSAVPGPTEGWPVRDLLAELAGPPVTGTLLPPIR